jgi:prepilin-type N-terminal cleavage/methylation domain-containing protein
MQTRRGFTLIETVVTVGLLAVLAAFVVPSVLRRAETADPLKVATDLNSISTAVQSFATDVKGGLPGDLEDLVEPILSNGACSNFNLCDSTITHRDIFTVQQIRLWRGPYLAASVSASPVSAIRSGYVANIHNSLVRYDATSGIPEFCSSGAAQMVPCPGFVVGNLLFVGVRVDSLNHTQALTVNGIIDGPNEQFPGVQGRFRFPQQSTPTALATPAYFLAAPVP